MKSALKRPRVKGFKLLVLIGFGLTLALCSRLAFNAFESATTLGILGLVAALPAAYGGLHVGLYRDGHHRKGDCRGTTRVRALPALREYPPALVGRQSLYAIRTADHLGTGGDAVA